MMCISSQGMKDGGQYQRNFQDLREYPHENHMCQRIQYYNEVSMNLSRELYRARKTSGPQPSNCARSSDIGTTNPWAKNSLP